MVLNQTKTKKQILNCWKPVLKQISSFSEEIEAFRLQCRPLTRNGCYYW
jgi:hypothetical protein